MAFGQLAGRFSLGVGRFFSHKRSTTLSHEAFAGETRRSSTVSINGNEPAEAVYLKALELAPKVAGERKARHVNMSNIPNLIVGMFYLVIGLQYIASGNLILGIPYVFISLHHLGAY